MRKLEKSSWLAQIIRDKLDVESAKMGLHPGTKWLNLHTLYVIVKEADNPGNDSIYYDNHGGKRQIIIRDIPSMAIEYGSDYDREGMRSKLLGLQAGTKDDDGMYTVSVLITNDLNSATILDISEVMYQIDKF